MLATYRSSRGGVILWRQASEPFVATTFKATRKWQIQAKNQAARTTYTTLSSGLSHVTSDQTLAYAIQNKVLTDNSLAYAIQNKVVTDNTLAYTIFSKVLTDNTLAYTIFNKVLTDNNLAYAIQNKVVTDNNLVYSVFNKVVADQNLAYFVRATVNTDYAVLYFINTKVVTDYSLSYTIQSSLDHVTSDQALAYVVRNGVVVDQDLAYVVRNTVFKSQTFVYTIAGGVALRSPNIVYNVGGESRVIDVRPGVPQEVLDAAPGSVLDFAFDWSDWLDGANVASYTFSNGFYLTRSDESESAGILRVYVETSADAPISMQTRVSCTIITDEVPFRKDTRTIKLKVADR